MSIFDDWKREESEHKQLQRTVFPMSGNKPRRVKGYGVYEKSPHRSKSTSKQMSTTFRYNASAAASILRLIIEEEGTAPTSLAQILRYAVDSMENVIRNEKPELLVQSETEAILILEQFGLSPAQGSLANQKRVSNLMTLESALNRPVSQRSSGQPSGNSNGFTSEQITAAVKFHEQRMKPVQKVDLSLVAPENKISSDCTFPADDGLPVGWPKPSEPETKTKEKLVTILSENGTSVEAKRDRLGRKSALLICTACYSVSQVILNFEPQGDKILSDTCPKCEGITEHYMPSEIERREMAKGISWEKLVQNPEEQVSSAVPLDKFRKQMLNPTVNPTPDAI